MKNRRTFIRLLLALIAVRASAQQPERIRRIGVLGGNIAKTGFADQMSHYGWVEGRNLAIERRSYGGDTQRSAMLAAELARLDVEVIVTFGAVASSAARDTTRTIPIVCITGDPVLLGLVPNLSHPGGNITGVTNIAPELAGKRLEILRSLLPNIVRVAELVDPANEYIRRERSEYEKAFRALGMEPLFVELPAPSELRRAFAEISRRRAEALIIRADPVFNNNRDEIIGLAKGLALPTMAEGRPFVTAGALVSYAPDEQASWLRMAAQVDKILKGAKPANIPIEQPTTLKLVINVNTAKALGLKIPESLRVQDPEFIQ
jgi:putative ABC transport system substrate-binding protein